MGVREVVCLAIVTTLIVGCRGQQFTASASYRGDTITVTFSVPGNYECQLDNGPFVPCANGFAFSGVPVGTHNVTVRGTRQNGQSVNAFLGPLVQRRFSFSANWISEGTFIRLVFLNSSEAATYECQLDSGPFVPCSVGFNFTEVSSGSHTVSVRATGSISGATGIASRTLTVASDTAVTFSNIRTIRNITAKTITFNYAISERFPVQCRIRGGSINTILNPCPSTINTSEYDIGSYEIEFFVEIDGEIRGRATQQFVVVQDVIIEFKDISYSVVEGERFYTATLVKRGEPANGITVGIVPQSGSAEAVRDFDTGRETVVFSPGDPDEKTVLLSVKDDSILEANETYFLQLDLSDAAQSGGATLGPQNRAGVTIVNDDVAFVEFATRESTQLEITESNAEPRVRVRVRLALDSASEVPIPFTLETFDIDATAGSDYQPVSQRITLEQTRQNPIPEGRITVRSIDDNEIEANEFIGVRIVIPPEFQDIVKTRKAQRTIQIIDNDEGDLELDCYAVVGGDRVNGRNVSVFFTANQPAVFNCRINDGPVVGNCISPHIFTNVGLSDSVTVTITADATARNRPQKTCTKQVLFVEGGLQVTGIGEITAQIQSTKSATYRCKLNDGEFIDCVDGQVFSNLASGTYTLFVEANGTVDRREFASDFVGPASIVVGIDSNRARAFAACFGEQTIDGQYSVNWRTRGDRVEFRLSAQTQGWVGIGFSADSRKPNSDIVVGAASTTNFFVDDRYAVDQESSPEIDAVQNLDNVSASFANGVTTVTFSRDKFTNDIDQDVTLDICRYFLYAWGDNVNVNRRVIGNHGNNFKKSSELFCFPVASFCLEKFVCRDPGTPVNGGRTFTDGLTEGSVVTYTCNSGYRLSGTPMQTCVLSESQGPIWREGSLPTCILDVCRDPGQPANGFTIGSDFSVGEAVVHTCNDGFVLVGEDRRVCQPNGQWSDPLPSCVPVCVEIANGSFPVIDGNFSVIEGNTREVCVVVKNGSVPVPFNVTITPVVTSPTEAIPNTDYDPSSKTVTFNPGDVVVCTEINTTQDTILENTERFIALLTLPQSTINLGVTRGPRIQAPISIIDDDRLTVRLKEERYIVRETEDAVIGIQASRQAGTPFTVTISTTPGTASEDDYVPDTRTVTFAADQTMAFVTIPTKDDDIVEGDEVFTVILNVPEDSESLGVQKDNPDEATVTIEDDDDSITVRFKEPDYNVTESDEEVEVCLLKEGENSVTVPVIIQPRESDPQDATAGDDFPTSDIIVNFAPDQTESCVKVPVVDDNIPEDDETFIVEIQPSNVTTTDEPSSATVTVVDDDREIEYVNGSSIKVDEEEGEATICLRRTGNTQFPIDVSISYISISATETADFAIVTVVVMFAANQEVACFKIPILEDDITEDNEIFEISAVPTVGGSPVIISVCIRDNDNVIFRFTEPEFIGNETERTATVCIEKVGRNEIPVNVTFTSLVSPTADNPATVVDDFTRFSATITYDRGSNGEDNIQCIEVLVVDDNDIEPPEILIGKLTSGDPEETPDDEVPIIINDNDGVRVAFKRIKYFVTEGDGPVELCLEKLGEISNAVTVAVSSSDDTASALSDYTAVFNSQITFQPEETMKCFEIDIINNALAESVENFTVTVVTVAGDVGVIEPDVAVVCITDDDVERVCRMEDQNVFPFSITGLPNSYPLRDVCEHTVVTTCMDSDDFTINVDYTEGSGRLARVGIKYNDSKIVILEDLTVTVMGLGNPIAQSGLTREYANQIFITENSRESIVDLRDLGVKVTRTSSDLEIETSSGRLSGDLCGLCGRYGVLLNSDRMTVADLTSADDIQEFTNSWRSLPLDMFLRDEARKECGMNANDTIIGDPLFKVPIHVRQELIDENPELEGASLCYEIHGKAGSSFNLVSDRCTSVNAFYIPMNNPVAGNIIGAIGITAIDQDGVCHTIEARLEDGCSAIVDGDSLPVRGSYVKAGIRVYRRTNRVRIAIPNCGNVDLVLWFICQDMEGQMMSKFVIARGVNLQPSSHGFVGQFWNVPIEVDNFQLDPPALPHYTVNVTASNGESRTFVGMFYERAWDLSQSPCLYVGNKQGGPSGEFDDPNDSVLQGSYKDYEVSSLFSNDFIYSVFDSDTCGLQ